MEKEDTVVSAKIPLPLGRLIQQFLQRDGRLNESDLVRDALREKIQREAPELYKRLFQEVSVK
jgi:Arc/MetJ-type ribon-helix-helix transcriptional regulator